tara:strand:- start:524 stop:625 length:102 start_codon:yes stop_codon:yes gene_type:complete
MFFIVFSSLFFDATPKFIKYNAGDKDLPADLVN